MVHIERCEPIGEVIEERIAFHLREPAEINIGATLLHLHHSLHALLQFLHGLVGSLGVQDVVHGIVFFLHDAHAGDVEALVLDEVGHDIALYLLTVALSVHAEIHLHLHLKQLACRILVVGHPRHHIVDFGIEPVLACRGERPSHQRPLLHPFVGSLSIHLAKHGVFVYVEVRHRSE